MTRQVNVPNMTLNMRRGILGFFLPFISAMKLYPFKKISFTYPHLLLVQSSIQENLDITPRLFGQRCNNQKGISKKSKTNNKQHSPEFE